MLRTKVFTKKNRKGGIVKVVREHYLREDVACGAEHCKSCDRTIAVLEGNPDIVSQICDFPHYLLLDTNVVLHQSDVLEDDIFRNVILLQTVLEEVKHRSFGVYKKVREIIAGRKEKRFYVFPNEHHKDTFVERLKGESPNDRNDRAIRVAAKWYEQHLQALAKNDKEKVSVVVVTNDKVNKEKALQDGLETYTIHEYVEQLYNSAELLDKLSGLETLNFKESGQILFPEHLPLSTIQSGLKSGKYIQGTVFGSRENYLEATVFVQGKDEEVFLQGLRNLNRAVHGDVVAVEVLAKEEWTCPSSVILKADNENEIEDEKENQVVSEVARNEKAHGHRRRSGKVVGIIKRGWRPYCGTILPEGNLKANRQIFIPADRQIPRIYIETRQAQSLVGKRIIVNIDGWPKTSRYPQGHYVKVLGDIGDKETENEVLLLEHDVPHSQFSQAVLKDLPVMPWRITEQDYAERRDLRSKYVCSIDPPGCTDIDDALHCRPLENGNFEVGVHIADVTHFIKPGTALDEEAADRCTSVYLVDKRIDMVPELLSSNLCSLHSNVERLAFSCVWELTADADIVSVDFFKSVINSKASLTYAEAQMLIDDPARQDELSVSLRHLNSLAKVLKKRRMDAGALSLASSEVRFHVDSETHDPVDVAVKELKETNSLVEEFMLLANVSVAKKILHHFPEFAVLRRHPRPPPANFEPILKVAKCLRKELVVSSGKGLASSLDQATFPEDHYLNILLRILTTRCMTQAQYFCTGNFKTEDFFHFGLAAPIYTHFTSPIRRYADVLVHRLLGVAIGVYVPHADLMNREKIQKACNQMNYRHKMAQYAGRASVHLHTQIFFQNRKTEEEGYILNVRRNALQIMIPKYGLEGTIYLSKKNEKSPYVFDDENCLIRSDAHCFRVFDKVTVQISIEKRDLQSQLLHLRLVKPIVPGLSVPPFPRASGDSPETVAKRAKLA